MKTLNLAIASLVDANTGNGVNRRFIEQFASVSSDYEQRGREIRAKSILAALAKIKASFKQYIEDSRVRAKDKADTRAVLEMGDHQLNDLGLNRADLYDLRAGQITLGALEGRRELNRIQASGNLRNEASNSVEDTVRNIESANQENYGSKKCA